jgi:hypothetical protein
MAQIGSRKDQPFVSPGKPVSLAARERLKDHQAVAAQAVAAYSVSLSKLEASRSRRAQAISDQDVHVAKATAENGAALLIVAQAVGADIAADVLGLTNAEVRRIIKDAKG